MAKKQDMKVLVVLPDREKIVQKIKRSMPFLDIHYYPSHLVDNIPEEDWGDCKVLYTERALPALELVPNLEWIQFHYAGIDYAVNSSIFKKPGLQVTTLSGVPALPMGEYALMMILALGHQLEEMRNYQANHIWPENRFMALTPMNYGKVL